MTAAYPTVHAALVAATTAAFSGSQARVVDGYDLSSDPSDVVLIGVPSLTDTQSISAGSFTQTTATLGTARSRDELGTINGVAMARNGEGDQAAARTAVFGYIALLEAALRADPSLGVTTLSYLVAQFSSGDLLEDQVNGATSAISFTVAYKARI